MRKVEIGVEDLFGLIHAAEDVGCGEYIPDLIKLAGGISNEDIEEYANSFLTDEYKAKGYTEEDYEDAKDKLTEYQNRYK